MKVFKLSDGSFVQIINKDKIMKWDPELPVLFVNYILDKKVDSYGSTKDQAEIRAYLNEVLEEIAIPKLSKALRAEEKATRLTVANSLQDISKKKPDMVKAVIDFVKDAASKEDDKDVQNVISQVIKNYERSIKRKQYEAKRKKMRELDAKLVSGKITADEYSKERKEYLSLSSEFEDE